MILMLTLLVFSASVTGVLVFGYAGYLAINNQIKDAWRVFAYTLLYLAGLLALIIAAAALF